MAGTCIPCPKIELASSCSKAKYHVYSYYEELSQVVAIQKKLLQVHDAVNELCENLYKYIIT